MSRCQLKTPESVKACLDGAKSSQGKLASLQPSAEGSLVSTEIDWKEVCNAWKPGIFIRGEIYHKEKLIYSGGRKVA